MSYIYVAGVLTSLLFLRSLRCRGLTSFGLRCLAVWCRRGDVGARIRGARMLLCIALDYRCRVEQDQCRGLVAKFR